MHRVSYTTGRCRTLEWPHAMRLHVSMHAELSAPKLTGLAATSQGSRRGAMPLVRSADQSCHTSQVAIHQRSVCPDVLCACGVLQNADTLDGGLAPGAMPNVPCMARAALVTRSIDTGTAEHPATARTEGHFIQPVPGAVDHREALCLNQLPVFPRHTVLRTHENELSVRNCDRVMAGSVSLTDQGSAAQKAASDACTWPAGLSTTPGKVAPSRSSCAAFCHTNFVPAVCGSRRAVQLATRAACNTAAAVCEAEHAWKLRAPSRGCACLRVHVSYPCSVCGRSDQGPKERGGNLSPACAQLPGRRRRPRRCRTPAAGPRRSSCRRPSPRGTTGRRGVPGPCCRRGAAWLAQ